MTPRRAALSVRVLLGLATAAIVLQGLWAGIFLEHDGQRDASGSWIDAHARGADAAIVLAAMAATLGYARLRRRTDLWLGSAVLTVLLVAESWIGGQVRDHGKDSLTAVHVPLAMVVLVLATRLVVVAKD